VLQSNRKTALYCRLALEDAAEMNLQVSKAEEIAKANGFPLYSIYADNGYSGNSDIRPDFQRLLEEIRQDKIDAIVTVCISRLYRDILLCHEFCDICEKHGVVIYTPTGVFGRDETTILKPLTPLFKSLSFSRTRFRPRRALL